MSKQQSFKSQWWSFPTSTRARQTLNQAEMDWAMWASPTWLHQTFTSMDENSLVS